MKKKIKVEVYSKQFDEGYEVKYSDIPKGIVKDDDVIVILHEDAFWSENNSWDAFVQLEIWREREETDEEYNKRLDVEKRDKEDSLKRRYTSYLKLKEEFELEERKPSSKRKELITEWWNKMDPTVKKALLDKELLTDLPLTFSDVRDLYNKVTK